MTEPLTPAALEDHAHHDPTWMAALATRDPDLSESERTRAQAALKSCGACADLFADLVAVSAAIPTAALPTRPRDFTLTAADAARLRPGGLRRWLAGIGSVRDGITFPLALGLTTMGIAGLLVATVPAAFSGMGGATAATP
jgi:anti-sigma factor RsiW